MEINYNKLADVLQAQRVVTKGGITLKGSLRSVATIIGISHNAVSRVEQGNPCDLESYAKICKFLKVSLDTFVKK